MSARPGSAPMSAVSCRLQPRQRPRQVHGVDGGRRELGPAGERLAVGGDDDVGDGAVDHEAGVEDDGPDRGAFGQLLDRIGVGFVGGKQRELGQRRAQQRRRRKRFTQFFEDDGGVGELAPCAAQLLGHHQRGRSDLLAQQLPQRLVVAVLRLDRLADRRWRCVLVDQRRDGFAQQLAFLTHEKASNTRRRCHVGSPHADRNACTRRQQK